MEKGSKLEIHFVEEISSTHIWLCNAVKNKDVTKPFALYAKIQNDGVGSRGNVWKGHEGNLFLSFALPSFMLPNDLPHVSASIYFSQLLLEFLREKGSLLRLKWPNDFYLNDKKIGGTATAKIEDFFIISIGMNLAYAEKEYGVLDISITPDDLVNNFISSLKDFPLWKHIFSKYKLEFQFSQNFGVHVEGKYLLLKEANLCPDGSIEIEGKKVYSLR
ncbi:MAG: biotin--[acetyl-CoA-carboxylase] ligase [Campylobacteraceae bacterium]|jgi:BirA family biotin operon repressor/biotin-[acetyl-CoA-carboxylase] ligase|nr:biotin--[acetyl-CoA-carboxylase] ligase [Campylobacteraceae bacterium]